MGDAYSTKPSHIVGIGASAGGLDALVRFFENLPEKTGMAFIVVQHLSPDFKSLMNELLVRHTRIAIKVAEEGVVVEPNTIYLNVPSMDVVLHDDCLSLRPRQEAQPLFRPIDALFRSLGEQARERAVAVVLSGSGTDGARGIGAVHAGGGVVMAQEPETAEFASMPRAAVDAGVVDLVLPPGEMAASLMGLVNSPGLLVHQREDSDARDAMLSEIEQISTMLNKSYGLDFAVYKQTTIQRRIERRLEMSAQDSLMAYRERLTVDPEELDRLYCDMLIGVTRFFRNPESFALLEYGVLPGLLERLPSNESVRVWVAGCATGEEAYSLSMLLVERLGEFDRVQIFATDVHPGSLRVASKGLYEASTMEHLSKERRERYFVQERDGYFRVSQNLRKTIVFAQHNVLSDAPFSNVHMVSCRNMLIYLQAQTQKQVLQNFHFALKINGILFLGKSESIGDLKSEFEAIDASQRIFRKTHYSSPIKPTTGSLFTGHRVVKQTPRPPSLRSNSSQLLEAYDDLLREYAPPGLLLSHERQLLHTLGDAHRYLRLPEGRPTTDALELITPELRLALSGTLSRALQSGEPSSIAASLLLDGDNRRAVEVRAKPLKEPGGGVASVLVTFVDRMTATPVAESYSELTQGNIIETRVLELERELQWTRESLQITLEESDATNEELQATNEELVASNEELQSTNEELQATNEELFTINTEYQQKNAELIGLMADLDHLFKTTAFGVIFLDKALCIRRYTDASKRIFKLLPQDEGRPLEHLTSALLDTGTVADARHVLETGETVERQVTHTDGSVFLMTILPYRRSVEQIEGVVMSFVDVTPLHNARKAFETSMNELQLVLNEAPVGLLHLKPDMTVKWANTQSIKSLGLERQPRPGEPILNLLPPNRNRETLFRRVLSGESVDTLGVEIGDEIYDISYRPVGAESGALDGLVSVGVDVTSNVKQSQQVQMLAETLDHLPFGVLILGYEGTHPDEQELTMLFANNASMRETNLDKSPTDMPNSPALPTLIRTLVDNRAFDKVLELRQAHQWTKTTTGDDPQTYRCHACPCGPKLVALTFEDITEQHQTLEQQFTAQRMEVISQLVGGLAHDLNNLLSIILLTGRALAPDVSGDKEMARDVETILQTSHRAADLLAQLMAFSQTRLAQPCAVAFDDAIANITPMLERIMGSDIALTAKLNCGDATVYIEPGAFEQVLVNLATNTRKAMPDGGTVTIATHHVENPTIRGRQRKGTFLQMDFIDDGIGMDALTLRRCFEPFFTSRPKGQGTGLGLSMCLGVTEQAGGTIIAESVQGRGSTFKVFLPPHEITPFELPPPAPVERPEPRPGGVILVVEDEDPLRLAIKVELRNRGYKVLESPNGQKAQEIAQTEHFDVLLTDVIMPGINGPALAQKLRAQRPGLPVVFMSGYTEHAALRNSLWEDGDALLVKPFDLDELGQAIKTAFKHI